MVSEKEMKKSNMYNHLCKFCEEHFLEIWQGIKGKCHQCKMDDKKRRAK